MRGLSQEAATTAGPPGEDGKAAASRGESRSCAQTVTSPALPSGAVTRTAPPMSERPAVSTVQASGRRAPSAARAMSNSLRIVPGLGSSGIRFPVSNWWISALAYYHLLLRSSKLQNKAIG